MGTAASICKRGLTRERWQSHVAKYLEGEPGPARRRRLGRIGLPSSSTPLAGWRRTRFEEVEEEAEAAEPPLAPPVGWELAFTLTASA